MSWPVVLRPEAEQDLLLARDWYDRQGEHLGDKFATQVGVVFAQLESMPHLFAVTWQDVRVCQLRRFPYHVYYRTLGDRVEVLAVLHANRDPSIWQSRAEPGA